MKPTLAPGLLRRASLAITEDLTVPCVSPRLGAFADMPPVFATAYMVAFLEATCIECLQAHLDPAEHTVGTHLDISHSAATAIGMTVTAEVELLAVNDRELTFRVTLNDDAGPISTGTHKRAVIDLTRFLTRTHARAGTGASGPEVFTSK